MNASNIRPPRRQAAFGPKSEGTEIQFLALLVIRADRCRAITRHIAHYVNTISQNRNYVPYRNAIRRGP